MWQLIKRDYALLKAFILFALFFKIALHVLTVLSLFSPNNLYYINFLLMMLYAFIFLMDDKCKVMRTIVSLPIKKRHIILSRYISLFSIGVIILAFAFIADYIVDPTSVHMINLYIAIGGLAIYVAISTPVYYLFTKVWLSIVLHYLLIMLGAFGFAILFIDPLDWFAPFIEVALSLLDSQPFMVSFISLTLFLYVSYRITLFGFQKKDIQ